MKIFQINTVYNSGSTGRIAADIKHALEAEGHECFVAYGRGSSKEKNTECVSNKLDLYGHVFLTRLTDKTGFYSKKATKRMIELIEEFEPDVIHLHNIHGYYLNYKMLFEFLAAYNKPVVWTLHDCWPYTGHCAYYDMAGCNKWQTECKKCPALEQYPKAMVDGSAANYKAKKEYFNLVEKMVLVTPSQWLADEAKKSFLGKYPVRVINNGIDRNVFKYTEGYVREKYSLGDKKVVLGVANIWDERKGLKDFVELSQELEEQYQIFLVGLSEKQIKSLPDKIKAIGRTENIKEMAELYSTADVYFNASVEETMGLTTIEALACETCVVTYDKTAVPEFVPQTGGRVVKSHDIQAVKEKIHELTEKEEAVDMEFVGKFNKEDKYKEYIMLYAEIKE